MKKLHKNKLIQKILKKEAVIGIYGLGYVGLPLALRFSDVGFKVVGFDIDEKKISSVNNGISYINDIKNIFISSALEKGFQATSDFSETQNVDVIIVCVPTPLKNKTEPDLSYVIDTTKMILPFFKKGQIYSLESTTYPGTTQEIILPILSSKGFTVGEDFYLAYSPEREDPGNKNFTTSTIPKVVSGISNECLEVAKFLYSNAVEEVVPVSNPSTAELTKLLENIHRAVNIGLVNEMKIVADKLNIDIHEVIEAASTKPFGFTPFYPGPGLGGHCIPIDPFYLTWKAKQHGVETKFIELAGKINTHMPHWVIHKLEIALQNLNKELKNSKILILGLAYKKDVSDMRESPSLKFLDILTKIGCDVDYSDPYIPVLSRTRNYNFNNESVDITPKNLKKYDAVVIITDHTKYDYKMIRENADLVLDTRNIYRDKFKNVVKA